MAGAVSEHVLNGVMGLVVADALGVPVEFEDRGSLRADPVTGMRGFGTYNQPAGTWSDDSSMTLALLESLGNGLDHTDIMDRFLAWFQHGRYTPHGVMFDIGIATTQALERYRSGVAPLEAGGTGQGENGNGSLMRILPVLFHLQREFGADLLQTPAAFETIHDISALTHRHPRSQIACGIYIAVAHHLTRGEEIVAAITKGIGDAFVFYRDHPVFAHELHHYGRLRRDDFASLPEGAIRSSGYVVDCLEAALWCLLTTGSYPESVLRAVNLGSDTDTTAAVTGGLAGLRYGYGAIPESWLEVIVKRDRIEGLCRGWGGEQDPQ